MGNEEGDGDTLMKAGEGEYKTATVFPAGSAMNLCKMLTFFRKGPFDLKTQYADATCLTPGTSNELGTYKVDLQPCQDVKKVKVKAKLTLHGTFAIEGAQIVEEEEYEETVKEKRELPDEEEPPKEEAAPPAQDAPMP